MNTFDIVKSIPANTVKCWQKQSLIVKIIVVIFVIGMGYFASKILFTSKAGQVQYQTETATKGVLIASVTASGQVASVNNTDISSNASGVVKQVFVSDGEEVTAGAKIAELDLDLIGKQKYNQALASYQSASNSLASAKSRQLALQATMFSNWDDFKNKAENGTYTNSDGSPNYTNRALADYHISEKEWLSAEADYKNQTQVIAQAQTAQSSAWFTLQQASPIIYAPISGTVTGLSLQTGTVVTNTSSSTATKIASVKTQAAPIISVSLTQIDVSKIKIGNKATVTFDAFSDKTFSGKVISIDLVGQVSSGVTSYPAIIALDGANEEILPNMSASASIITAVKDDALIVPSSAIQTQNGVSIVRTLVNGAPQNVEVQTGLATDTEIEIISGISEGTIVITGQSSGNQTTSNTQSPFNAFGGNNRNRTFGTGGGAVRISR